MEVSTHTRKVQSVVIVDSSVLIDYLADRTTPETNWLEQNLGRRRIGITTLILTEVLQGIRGEDRFAETLGVLERLAVFEIGGRGLAVRSARNYRALRQRGITIRNTIDCMNATFCILQRYKLLHNDRDFDRFEEHLDLEVLHPEPLN
jgi:predicted nucleic acid-binding protein